MIASLLLAAATPAAQQAPPAPVEVTAPGPIGALAGTLVDPDPKAPAVLIIPGSGPTDRDGNNPLGVKGSSYRLLADALAARGIATLRIDKRGMFGSRGAIADPNAVTIADYAADAHAWIEMLRKRTGRKCVWLLGHSEGGMIVLAAAQKPDGICGVILVSSPGRPLGDVMRMQFKANPANAPILDAALGMLDSLEAGRRVDPATLPAPLPRLFPAAVQGYLIDLLAQRPAQLVAAIKLPVLIVQGDRDLQVSLDDANALAQANPRAKLAVLASVNHVLKSVASDDRAANLATYGDPSLPIAPAVPETIATFVKAKR